MKSNILYKFTVQMEAIQFSNLIFLAICYGLKILNAFYDVNLTRIVLKRKSADGSQVIDANFL